MLFDEITVEKVVDAELAIEFMKEATKLATSAELEEIGQRLEEKSKLFQLHLSQEAVAKMDQAALSEVMSKIFGLRRKVKKLIRDNGFDIVKGAIQELLYGSASLATRFTQFVSSIKGFNQPMIISMGSELIHFTDPGKYWLWTPWIWDEKDGGGALPLVLQGEAEIGGKTAGEKYESVGKSLVLVHAMGQNRGYSNAARGMFGTDIFLACVYAVYMYTVFRMRLSQEFNRILPELPEMTKRVLGVYQ